MHTDDNKKISTPKEKLNNAELETLTGGNNPYPMPDDPPEEVLDENELKKRLRYGPHYY